MLALVALAAVTLQDAVLFLPGRATALEGGEGELVARVVEVGGYGEDALHVRLLHLESVLDGPVGAVAARATDELHAASGLEGEIIVGDLIGDAAGVHREGAVHRRADARTRVSARVRGRAHLSESSSFSRRERAGARLDVDGLTGLGERVGIDGGLGRRDRVAELGEFHALGRRDRVRGGGIRGVDDRLERARGPVGRGGRRRAEQAREDHEGLCETRTEHRRLPGQKR